MELKHSVVILTKDSDYHWYFISEISKVARVEGIIFEQSKRKKSLFKRVKKHGLLWSVLKVFSKITSKSVFKVKNEFKQFVPNFDTETLKDKFDHLVHFVEDINCRSTKLLLAKIKPDYLCSLGGGLIDEVGLEAASKGALNLHSGISPFYNGADMVDKVFESRNLNLIGCTLMLMTSRIDGGPILGHYLPGIEKTDSPRSLFMKNIIGGIELYVDFLTSDASQKINSLELVKQKIPMHYYIGFDHTIMTDLVKMYFLKNGMTERFIRTSKTFKYYRETLDFNEFLKSIQVIE